MKLMEDPAAMAAVLVTLARRCDHAGVYFLPGRQEWLCDDELLEATQFVAKACQAKLCGVSQPAPRPYCGVPGAVCPHCGQQGIQGYDRDDCTCPNCGKSIDVMSRLDADLEGENACRAMGGQAGKHG